MDCEEKSQKAQFTYKSYAKFNPGLSQIQIVDPRLIWKFNSPLMNSDLLAREVFFVCCIYVDLFGSDK